MSFTEKVVIVTGGTKGIGEATVRRFVEEGAYVTIAARSKDIGLRLEQELGSQVMFVQTDVACHADVKAMIDRTIEKWGRLDYAFNNAATMGIPSHIVDVSESMFDQVLNVNLKGIWLCMKYEIPHMLSQGSGAIVNASSLAGLRGASSFATYSASKFGIIGLTKSVALEYRTQGIRVNVVCPGWVKTPMLDGLIDQMSATSLKTAQANLDFHIKAGFLGTSRELADTVLFLCSDAASFITGHVLVVDGGKSAGDQVGTYINLME
jgi:NAD(P)-dependent dehydrogenase (short-subunit alcohol dehydrogenase family)